MEILLSDFLSSILLPAHWPMQFDTKQLRYSWTLSRKEARELVRRIETTKTRNIVQRRMKYNKQSFKRVSNGGRKSFRILMFCLFFEHFLLFLFLNRNHGRKES